MTSFVGAALYPSMEHATPMHLDWSDTLLPLTTSGDAAEPARLPMLDDRTREMVVTPPPAPPTAVPEALGLLTIIDSPDPCQIGRTFPLRGDEVHVGRDSANTIALNDPDVSRQHALLIIGAAGHRILDLNSTNGTQVNGGRISETRLKPGDLITVGSTSFTYERG
jgi:hypothetical protein